MPSVRIESLSVTYSRKKSAPIQAVSGLNAVFPDRKISCLIGVSGCGKTTLLRAIAGLADYDGSVLFDDIDLRTISIRERNVAYVNQDIVLYPHLSVYQNIAFPLSMSGASPDEIRKRVYEVSEKLGISTLLTRKPREISEGQAQRVCLAKALVKRAYVYLFDEPFSNLDERNRDAIRRDLKRTLSEFGATAVFVTHSIREAYVMGDCLFVMDEGKIVDQGDAESIAASRNEKTRLLTESKRNESL